MQQRVNNKTKVSQKRDSQANMQRNTKTEESSNERMHDVHPLENISCRIGDSACAAKHISVIQRTGLFHPMNESQKVQSLLRLQQQYGNQFVQRVIAPHAIQAKLQIGQPGDIYEQEADRVAEQVMQMPEPQVQRQPEEEEEEIQMVQRQIEKEEEEELQAKELPGQTSEGTPNLKARINATQGGGQPLPVSTRAFFEPRFSYDFSQVRVHTDAEADTLNSSLDARAFTTGQDIFFRQGAYNPGSSSGRELVAHELTHVVQQNGDKVQRRLTIDQLGDKYESEAGQVARAIMQQEQQSTLKDAGSGLVRLQEEEEETVQTKAESASVQRQDEEAAPIEPVRIVRDKNLWWFAGEDPANYDVEAKLTAFGGVPGATRGTFQWDVVRGAGIVDFQNNSDSMTRVNANRIGIKSTDASAAMGDVKVRCRWSHGSAKKTLFHSFTVRAPEELNHLRNVDNAHPTWVYESRIHYSILDQFGTTLPRDVPINEEWTSGITADFPGMNWRRGPEGSATVNPADWNDWIGGENVAYAANPAPVAPGDPDAGVAVYHWDGDWRAGSLTIGNGRRVSSVTWQKNRGFARHT